MRDPAVMQHLSDLELVQIIANTGEQNPDLINRAFEVLCNRHTQAGALSRLVDVVYQMARDEE